MKSLLEMLREGEPPPFDVIDMHGHIGRYAYPIADLSTAGLLRVLDRVHVSTMLCSHMQCMSADTDWGNEELLQHMQAASGRILGYASVFPSSPGMVRTRVAHCFENGFCGLKLHDANHFPYDDTAYEPAYELAHDKASPVLLHTWGDPDEFAAAVGVAKSYPNLTIILAHGGSSNPDGYIETALAAPNIVIDTCFSRCPPGLVEYLVRGAGADKIVFGSDAYFYSLTQQLGKIMAADVDDEIKKRILHDNAAEILSRVRH